MHDRKLPPAAIKLFVKDVFGADDENGIHHEGLVDCHTEDEFQIKLAEIKHLWDDLELQNGLEPQFHAWFGKYKAENFCSSTLRGVREKAGLGCPPHPYYTNSNESMNRAIKEKTQWKKSQLPEFLDRMKELVCEQQCELEKAVIGTGEYILKERFKGLEVSQTAWSRMNEDQRLHYVKRYNRWKLGDEISKASGKGKERKKSYHGDLSPTPEVVAEMLSMPLLTVQCIWKKASDLSADSTAIAPMPGGGGKDCFVLSHSSTRPHAVTARGETYQCDSRCMHFSSLSISANTVAAAIKQGSLSAFIHNLNLKKTKPNLFHLSRHGMPLGAGRKGGIPPRRKRQQKTTFVENDETALASQLHYSIMSNSATPPMPCNPTHALQPHPCLATPPMPKKRSHVGSLQSSQVQPGPSCPPTTGQLQPGPSCPPTTGQVHPGPSCPPTTGQVQPGPSCPPTTGQVQPGPSCPPTTGQVQPGLMPWNPRADSI